MAGIMWRSVKGASYVRLSCGRVGTSFEPTHYLKFSAIPRGHTKRALRLELLEFLAQGAPRANAVWRNATWPSYFAQL